MKLVSTSIPDLLLIEPRVFEDDRGFFFESFNAARYAEQASITAPFIQDNHSLSRHGVLRGLHFQRQFPQGKLVRVIRGEVFDVAVDLRLESPTYGQWVGAWLSDENKQQMWIPPGFAHGFLTLSAEAECEYKCTEVYHPEDEVTLAWDDPELGIDWPLDLLASEICLSDKDKLGLTLQQYLESCR